MYTILEHSVGGLAVAGGGVEPVKCPRNRLTVRELVRKERACLADPGYLAQVQGGRISPGMRGIALDWIFELVDSTEGSSSNVSVYPAACCIFDRYLSVQPIVLEDLQDTALSALLCASRILEPSYPLAVSPMENYYRINKLKKIEDQFLNTVNIAPNTLVLPTDYFSAYTQILSDSYSSHVICDVLYHTHNLLPVFYTEYESVLHPPSVIAGACLLESVNRLLGQEECLETLKDIVRQTGLHPSYFIKATKDLRKWISKLVS